jgi:hypothetical protein
MRMFAAPEINSFLGMYDSADKAAIMLVEDSLEQVILPLSANNLQGNEPVIYPNPIIGNSPLFLESKTPISSVTVYNAAGQKINVSFTKVESNRYAINGIQRAGVYLIQFQTGNKLFTKKIVKSF